MKNISLQNIYIFKFTIIIINIVAMVLMSQLHGQNLRENRVLDERVKNGQGIRAKETPRILVAGCPMAVPNWKIPWLVESSDAIIVGEESCVGERGTQWLTEESGDSIDRLIDNLVERYFQIDCAVFTPNLTRLEHIRELAKKYHAQGVLHYNLQFCQPYQIETDPVEKILESDGIPVLRIDTEYSQEDAGQIKTRVEAFVERIKG